MEELKRKIEAILFSVGRYTSAEEISALCRTNPEKVKETLLSLKVDYETDKETSLVVLNDENMWKLTTREEYGNVVRKIVTETELTKSQLETLAVIAFKYPIKQADLIRIRTNKAYDHLMELEKAGYITRQRYGRSRLIKLTDKFFDYFDLPQEKLKDRFKGFEQLAKTIENKEENIHKVKADQRKIAEETKKIEDAERSVMEGQIEIDLIDDNGQRKKLEIVDEKIDESPSAKIGELEVVDIPPEKNDEQTEKEKPKASEDEEKEQQEDEKNIELQEDENEK
jgi:segregation and condensation protein B